MKILSIDPGKKMCGWAVFHGERLSDCGLARTKSECLVGGALDMADQIQEFPDAVAIEKMRVYKSAPINPEHLINISIVSGVMAGAIMAKKSRYLFPYPRDWKKNLPKEECNDKILDLVPESVAIMDEKKIAKTHRNHVLDAIGIGLWAVKKENKGK